MPPKKDHTNIWQKQADHFQALITKMNEIIADPDSSDEDKAEANQTIADMQANLKRLVAKHGVTPTAGGVTV